MSEEAKWPEDRPFTTEETEIYRLQTAQLYQDAREDYRLAFQLQGDHGKWLVATLALANLGGLSLLNGSTLEIPLNDKLLAFALLVAGLVLALFTGLVTWWNWQLVTEMHKSYAVVGMLVNHRKLPKNDPKLQKRIDITFWSAIILGITSVACMAGAAGVIVWSAWI